MLSLRASPLSLHRWVERLPKQYCACLSGKSQKESWTRKMLFRGVAESVYCHGDQAHKKEAGGRSEQEDHKRNSGESASIADSDKGMPAVQYSVY